MGVKFSIDVDVDDEELDTLARVFAEVVAANAQSDGTTDLSEEIRKFTELQHQMEQLTSGPEPEELERELQDLHEKMREATEQ